jgi:hypothetical protein
VTKPFKDLRAEFGKPGFADELKKAGVFLKGPNETTRDGKVIRRVTGAPESAAKFKLRFTSESSLPEEY